MDRQERDALYEHITALEAQCAAQAEALRATRDAAPPPLAPLWRIALLCQDALASPALPPAWRPYVVQIAQACREGITREDGRRGT